MLQEQPGHIYMLKWKDFINGEDKFIMSPDEETIRFVYLLLVKLFECSNFRFSIDGALYDIGELV